MTTVQALGHQLASIDIRQTAASVAIPTGPLSVPGVRILITG